MGPKTVKALEENRLCPHDVGVGKDFRNRAAFTQELRPTTDKHDFIEHGFLFL